MSEYSNRRASCAKNTRVRCNPSPQANLLIPANQTVSSKRQRRKTRQKFFFDFNIFGAGRFGPKSRHAARKALGEMDRALGEYDKRIDTVLCDPRLSKSSREFIRNVWWGDCFDQALSWGNRHVRRAACTAAIAVCLQHANSDAAARKGNRRLRMLTTSAELGITSYAQAEIRLAAVTGHFDRAMRSAGMEGIGFLDIGLFHRTHGTPPEAAAFHLHGFARAQDASFRVKLAENMANPSRFKRNSLGGKIVRITFKGANTGRSLSRKEVAQLGYYTSKISCGLNTPVETEGARWNDKSMQDWDTFEALRQLEFYSRFDAMQVVRGVGKLGKELRREWKELLRQALGVEALPWGPKLDHEALMAGWCKLYEELQLPFAPFRASSL